MKHFNIYYLNFSKVYDLNMLLDKFQPEEIVAETQTSAQSENETGMGIDIISLNNRKGYGEYSKFTERIKVKHEKSTLVKQLIPLCEINKNINNIDEGTLLLINDVKIEFYDDEETQRIYSLFQKSIFEGVKIEGINIDKLISTVINDMSYFMKCKTNNETIVFKIPMENEFEFENKYTINDLLIGKLTVLGVYKGKINEKDFKRTTVYSALENEKSDMGTVDIIESSNEAKNEMSTPEKDKEHFIDIFAIIQPINLNDPEEADEKEDKESEPSLLTRIKNKLIGEEKC